jgi:hypothetical protein
VGAYKPFSGRGCKGMATAGRGGGGDGPAARRPSMPSTPTLPPRRSVPLPTSIPSRRPKKDGSSAWSGSPQLPSQRSSSGACRRCTRYGGRIPRARQPRATPPSAPRLGCWMVRERADATPPAPAAGGQGLLPADGRPVAVDGARARALVRCRNFCVLLPPFHHAYSYRFPSVMHVAASSMELFFAAG